MAKIKCFLCFLCFLMFSCENFASPKDRCINQIVHKAAAALSEDGFVVAGVGVNSAPGDQRINSLHVSVNVEGPLNQERGRQLIVCVARVLRDQINETKCAEQLFQIFPVALQGLEASVFTTDHSEPSLYSPYIRGVHLRKGTIEYFGRIDNESVGYDFTRQETLEEALEKLGESSF